MAKELGGNVSHSVGKKIKLWKARRNKEMR